MGAEGAPVCLWSRVPQGTHHVPIRSLYRGDLQGPTQLGGGWVRVCWALGRGGGKQKGPYLLESSSCEWVAVTLCKRKKLVLGCSPQGLPEGRSQVFLSSVAPQGRVRALTAHTRPYKRSALGCSRGETGRGGSTRQGKPGWARCPAGSPVGGEAEAGDPGLLGIRDRFSTLGSFPSCPSPLAAQDVGTALCPAGQPALGKLSRVGPHPTWASVPASQRRDTALPCPSPSSPAALPAGGWQPRRAEPEHPSPLTAPLNLPGVGSPAMGALGARTLTAGS